VSVFFCPRVHFLLYKYFVKMSFSEKKRERIIHQSSYHSMLIMLPVVRPRKACTTDCSCFTAVCILVIDVRSRTVRVGPPLLDLPRHLDWTLTAQHKHKQTKQKARKPTRLTPPQPVSSSSRHPAPHACPVPLWAEPAPHRWAGPPCPLRADSPPHRPAPPLPVASPLQPRSPAASRRASASRPTFVSAS
jgi:hypothetical protein